ncbi:MAG: ATP-binding cassette domain-containing protein [Phycisphaerales bacterium]
MPAAIAIEQVGRRFDAGTPALERVDERIEAGSLTVLVGPSGCGKTTLLRILGGLDAPTQGAVRFLDAAGAPLQRAQVPLAFAFQEPRLLPWRTVLDNIALPLELRGQARAPRHAHAQELARLVGLGDALHKLPAQLSGGMRMRAAIARALSTRPQLLLLDEPFGALDEITRASLDDLLLRLWRELGMTVVMVTHSVVEAAYVGERVLVMAPAPGRVVARLQPGFARPEPAVRGTEAFAAASARILHALGAAMAAGAAGAAGVAGAAAGASPAPDAERAP